MAAVRRSVLIVAYHFPPIGGAAAQRAVQLTRRLPDLGWEPVVLTGPGGMDYRWAPLDERLGDDLERRLRVHRLPPPEPARDAVWEGRRERWLRVPSAWERWWSRSVRHAARQLAGDVDAVHAILAPYQTAGSVREVGRELDLPLVVDLEDPWALDEMMVYPTRVHRRLELRRMARTLAAADAVVMNTAEAARRVQAFFPELRDRPVVAIPNAFDAEDFAAAPPARDDGAFRIVHTGSLHTDFGLAHRSRSLLRRLAGGAMPGVDFLTRSHVYLLEALQHVAAQRGDLTARAELHFAGVLTDADLEAARRAPVAVHVHGFLSHPDTIELIRSADLLFLPLHDVPAGSRVGLVPHKTYEYVASGRPILAAVPPGDARNLLAATGTAHVCDPADVRGMAAAILHELERWLRGEPAPPVPDEVLESHGAERLAADVARVYDRVAGA